jgi:hypothetical protein
MLNNKYTISEDYNSFLWLPAKTASTTIGWIFTHFNFYSCRFDRENNIFVKEDNVIHHFGHTLLLPPNHHNMIFISSTRHPYDRVLSFYKAFGIQRTDNISSKEGFKWYFENHIMNEGSLFLQSKKMTEDRIPDYFIRAENMYEDFLKIPFVQNSKLNHSGILEEMCQKKLNNSQKLELETYLTSEIKDIIYQSFKKEFDLLGYSK